MQRWQGAALAWVLSCLGALSAGCLDPSGSDKPGYSRWILDAGSSVPSAYADPLIVRKVDLNDGVASPAVVLKQGFAAGQAISYWDLGAGKRAPAPAYGFADCGPQGPSPRAGMPLVVDNLPGDNDYSPFRAIYWACVQPKYAGQVIDSLDAFNDAIDLGLISDPTGSTPALWYNQPIINMGVQLAGMSSMAAPSTAYYKGQSIFYFDMSKQNTPWPNGMTLQTNNVYELVKPGSMTPSRVIFSQPYYLNAADGTQTRNPSYSPSWLIVTLTLKAQQPAMPGGDANAALDALLMTLTNADDLVTVGMNNTVTVKNTSAIASATVTTNRANREFYVKEPM